MAKSSFSSRFPHAGKFLFLALVIGLGMTVFSVQKVPTNTEQHAQSVPKCAVSGGSCFYNQCATGYNEASTLNASCNPNGYYSCCIPSIKSAPTNVRVVSKTCKYYSGDANSGAATIKVAWNAVKGADRYRVYWKDTVNGSTISSNYSSYLTTTTYTINTSLIIKGKFYWAVAGYNSISKSLGPKSAYQELFIACK